DTVFPMVALLAWLFGTSVGYGGDAAPMGGAVEGQRILSTRSPREACKMYIVAEVVLFTLVWLVSVPCLAAALFWPQLRTGGLDRELAYGLLMTRYLTPGLLGLVYVAMLGGIISVVGDNLNFGSQVLLNDIYRRHLVRHASERHYMIAGRASVFLILGLALLVAFYRRAQPLGNWKPIQRLAGDLPTTAHGVRPIVKGIIIALCGAASVMAWIVGITYLYIGGYATGAVLLAVAVGLSVAFWK